MNQFQAVCAECPLRSRVDVARASESQSVGSEGVHSQLSDGSYRYEVTLANGEVCDSDEVRAIEQQVQSHIAACEGSSTGLLRRKCGAALASAWRWSERKGVYEPNIQSAAEITPLLADATYRDAMPHFGEDVMLVGDPEDFSELELGMHSAFMNYGIMKLTKTIRGTTAELKEGKAVMLDEATWSSKQDGIWRIRVAQGGPHFAFRSNVAFDTDDSDKFTEAMQQVYAEGIYAYLHADAQALAQSDELITQVETAAEDRYNKMEAYIASGAFRKDLEQGQERK